MSRQFAGGRLITKALRPTGAKAVVRQDPLLSFLQRESPSTVPPSPLDLPLGPFASTSNMNPFAPTKLPAANSWTPPKYSIRRQKLLKKLATEAMWPEDALPPMVEKAASPRAGAGQVYRASPHIPQSRVLDQLDLKKKGPYVGRKGAAFKGKIWERKFVARQEQLSKLLEVADDKAAAWKKVSSACSARVAVEGARADSCLPLLGQGGRASKEQASPAILGRVDTLVELGSRCEGTSVTAKRFARAAEVG